MMSMFVRWVYDTSRQLLALYPRWIESKRISELYRVGRGLVNTFDSSANRQDLDDGIARLFEAVDLRMAMDDEAGWFSETPAEWLALLANAIGKRQDLFGPLTDQDRVIDLLCAAVLLLEHHPNYFNFHVDLAHCLHARFRREGRRDDIDAAVGLFQRVAEVYPLDVDLWMALTSLAAVLDERFNLLKDPQDLTDAISYQLQAVQLAPRSHAELWKMHFNLCRMYAVRSKLLGEAQDLDESLKYRRELVRLRPRPDPEHSSYLYALGIALTSKFYTSRDTACLDEAIQTLRDVLDLGSEDPFYIKALSQLANCLTSKFESTGEMLHIEEAMRKRKEVLELLPRGPERAVAIASLANDLEILFEWSDDVRYLDEVMHLRRQALALCPDGDERADRLHELGESLQHRHTALHIEDDILESVRIHRDALKLRPVGHPAHAGSLPWLANALLDHHRSKVIAHAKRSLGDVGSLDEAISCYRQALDEPSFEASFVLRAACLHNLATSLSLRFELSRAVEDLDESIKVHMDSLELWAHNHRGKLSALISLASTHGRRFSHCQHPDDLNKWIHYTEEAQKLLPPDHSSHGSIWGMLALAYLLGGLPHDPFPLFEKAVTHKTSTVEHRFHTAVDWVIHARSHNHASIINAYSHALSLLDRCLLSRPTAELQHQLVDTSRSRSIAADACAAAIDLGQLETAVEFLEQGRGLLWASLTRYRHLLDALREIQPALADEYESVSKDLEALAVTHSGTLPDSPLPTDGSSDDAGLQPVAHIASNLSEVISQASSPRGSSHRTKADSEIKRLHDASERWDRVVSQIREIDRFKNFLKTAPYSELQKAAVDGPVIIVNVSKYRSDALIIRDGCPPVLIPLPDAQLEKLIELSSRLTDNLHSLHGAMSSGRIFGYLWGLLTSVGSHNTSDQQSGTPGAPDDPGKFSRRQIKEVLRSLWSSIVEPITVKLQELQCKPQSRVWWYPTGPLCRLPLHAAGPHRTGEDNFCDLYISSYITTLSRALESRSKVRSAMSPSPSMLVIGEPGEPDQAGFLPSVEKEISTIMTLSSSHTHSLSSLRVLLGEDATPEAVKAHLSKHPWVHFTCHGFQHPQPFLSSFQLHKAKIHLIELVQSHLQGAELAFLSACSTATGDIEGTPDEVIHLAAAMEFVGFRSVVGTLWPMRDDDGPDVTREFYTHMFRRSGGADFRDSAEALHLAVKVLREAKVPIDCWINFVHFGV